MALRCADPNTAARAHQLEIVNSGVAPGHRAFVDVDPISTCGIRTRFVEPADVPINANSPSEPAVDRINHLGIVSNDNDQCLRVFVDNLGCPLESVETDLEVAHVTESFASDKYGAVLHARAPEILDGVVAVFITVGDCELEVMMDFDSAMSPQRQLGEQAGNTKGDQSAIAKFLARRGPGLAHVAFQTADIDTLLQRLEGEGWRMIDRVGRPGGRGTRIGFVHPSNFGGGLLMHFVEPPR